MSILLYHTAVSCGTDLYEIHDGFLFRYLFLFLFFLSVLLPDPFIRRGRICKSPVFIHAGRNQCKVVFFQYTGRCLILDHGAGCDDLYIRIRIQILYKHGHCLRSNALSPEPLHKPVSDGDFVDFIPQAVHFCQAAEFTLQINAENNRLLQAFRIQLPDDFMQIRILFFKKKGGKITINPGAADQFPQGIRILFFHTFQDETPACQAGCRASGWRACGPAGRKAGRPACCRSR